MCGCEIFRDGNGFSNSIITNFPNLIAKQMERRQADKRKIEKLVKTMGICAAFFVHVAY